MTAAGFIGLGDQRAPMARAVAEAATTCTCGLRDDTDIADLLEHRRLLDGLRPGSVVVNHGTGEPGANVALGERFAAHGVAYLDAPVSGGGPGARARTLTTFVGGDPEVFQRCRAVSRRSPARSSVSRS